MKFLSKTLLELRHKIDVSQTGACVACNAIYYIGTDAYAKQSVARHRAISRDVRRCLAELLKEIDRCDARVEQTYQEAMHQKVIGASL